MTWLVAGASLLATWLNIRKVRLCFVIWLVTNATWAAYDFAHGLPAQGCLMCVYAALSVWGWFAWRTNDALGSAATSSKPDTRIRCSCCGDPTEDVIGFDPNYGPLRLPMNLCGECAHKIDEQRFKEAATSG